MVGDALSAPTLECFELSAAELVGDRQALIHLTRDAAAAGRAPGFVPSGPEAWLGWRWDEVIANAKAMKLRLFVARIGDVLVGAVQQLWLQADGWSGWEP